MMNGNKKAALPETRQRFDCGGADNALKWWRRRTRAKTGKCVSSLASDRWTRWDGPWSKGRDRGIEGKTEVCSGKERAPLGS